MALSTLIFSLCYTIHVGAQTLYSCEAPGGDPVIHTIDPATGNTLTTTTITLAGEEELKGCNGLAKDPSTGTCWIILSPIGSGDTGEMGGNRLLATIDETTGVATLVGNLGDAFAGITFDPSGTIYGITGVNAMMPSILYTIDKTNALPSFFQTLFTDDTLGGQAIAFNPVDGLIYNAHSNVFRSLNPNTNMLTGITLSGEPISEVFGFVHQSGNVFLASDIGNSLHSITITGPNSGVNTRIGPMGVLEFKTKGLAFDCGVAPPPPPAAVPTLSEWGLGAMAGILGIVGFMVIRRRNVLA